MSDVTSTTADGTYTVGAQIDITVKFDQSVTVSGTPQLALETGTTDRVADYISGSGSDTLTFRYTVQAGDSTGDLDYTGTDALTPNGGTIQNAGGTDADLTLPAPGATGSLGDNKAIVIDTAGPTVLNVTSSTANGLYASGDILILVQFSEAVTVSGSPELAVETGVPGRVATYTTGDGTDTLTFTYTIQDGDATDDLDYTATDALTLNGGTIQNGSGADAILTLPAPGATGSLGANQDIGIDAIPPALDSIVRVSGTPTNLSSVEYTVTFSEAVSGVDETDFSLVTTGLSGASITSVTPVDAMTYTVTVAIGSGDGTLRIDLKDDDTIVDVAGNPLNGPGSAADVQGPVYDVDNTSPLVDSIVRVSGTPTNASSVQFTVAFTEDVSGVDKADFAVVVSGLGGTVEVTDVVQVDNKTYTVTVSTGTGDGSVGLNLVDDDSIVDAAGNPLGGTGANTGDVTGPVYTLDRTVPFVTNITLGDPDPTNAASVTYLVTFSEDVSGLGTDDFSLFVVSGSIASYSITSVTGGPQAWTVTIDTGAADGVLRLDVLDDDSIVDAAGNALGGAGAGNGAYASGPAYTIDKTAPSAPTITRADANPTNAGSVSFLVAFSEDVNGVDLTDFALASDIGDATLDSITDNGGGNFTVVVMTGTGSGSIRLDFTNDSTVIDLAGNTLTGTSQGETYTIDKTAPTVLSITANDANPTNASSVTFTVTFSEPVTIDAADFVLGVNTVGASITSIIGGPTAWTVTVDTGSGSGSIRLDIADADNIADDAGNALGGAGSGNGDFTGPTYTIDKLAPQVDSIARASADPTNAATVDFTVTFSESVYGVDAGDFTLALVGVTGATIDSIDGVDGDAVYTVHVTTGNGTGTIGLNANAGASIADAATNPLAAGFTGETYTYDNVAPFITSFTASVTSPTNAASITYTLVFSEPVTSVTSDDFQLDFVGISSAIISGIGGGSDTWTVTVDTGTGSGTLTLGFVDRDTITDGVGNVYGGPGDQSIAGETFVLDRTAPSLFSIDLDDPTPTNAASVSFTVTFDEAVTGVDAADFDLALSGVGSAVITDVSGAGTTYTVSVSTGTGDGTIQLNLLNDGSIVDAVGNPLTAAANGPAYTIDMTAPTVSVEQAASQLDPTASQPILFTITFSEPVIGFGSGNITLTGTAGLGTASVVVSNPSSDNRTFDVTVSNITSDGTVTLAVAGGVVLDAAGNPNDPSTSTDGTVIYDTLAPSVTSITRVDGNPTNATSVSFFVAFSEAVFGVDTDATNGFDNFTLTLNGPVGATITAVDPTADPSMYIVTVDTGTLDGTLRLDLSSIGSIVDIANTPLSATHAGDEQYTIDKTVPNATFSVVLPNPSPTPLAQIDVTFDESVVGLDIGDFTLTLGGSPASLAGAVLSGSGASYTITGLAALTSVDGDYVLTLNSATAGVADLAGNSLAGDAVSSFTVDTTAPTVTVVEPTSGPTNSASLVFTVTFSEVVFGLDLDSVGGFDNFSLNVTGSLAGAGVTDVSSTADPLVYLVQVTAGSGVGTVQLVLDNTPAVADAAGNAVLGLPESSGTVSIDTVAPSVVIDDGDADNLIAVGTVPAYTIDITDANPLSVTLTAADLSNTGTASVSIGTISSSPIAGGVRYTVPVTALTGGTIVLQINGTASIADVAGNAVSLPLADNDTVVVDSVVPTVTVNPASGQSDPTNITTVRFAVVFSEPVVGFTQSSVTLSGTAGGLAGATKVVSNPSADNRTFEVTISGTTSDGTIQLDVPAGAVTDVAGNANTASSGGDAVILVDTLAPTVTSIVRDTPAAASTNASTLIFGVNFSEPVTGVDASDFSLTSTLFGANITAVTGSGSAWFVTVDTGTGEGTIRLNLIDNDSIQDAATNRLGGLGASNGSFTTGEVYTVDRTLPTVSTITRLDPPTTNLASVRFRVTFSEPVQVSTVSASDFSVATSGVSFGAVSVAQVNAGSLDTQFDVTVNGLSGNGSLQLNVNGSTAAILDAAGNDLAQNFSGPTYTIDQSGPAVTVNQASSQGDPTRTQPIRFAIVFDEAVSGFNSSMITRTGTAGGLAGATLTVANPSSDSRTFEVTVSGLTGDGTVALSVAAGVVTDTAGNANAASTSTDGTVTLDTVPPSVSLPDLIAASDSGSSPTDNITNVTTPTFTGTAEAGATLQLLSGTTILGTTTATGGVWTITTGTLADGVYNVFARATDAAGNQAESAILGVTIDTVGPTAAVTRASGQPASASASSTAFTVQFAVTFSQAITGLSASDLTVGGTAGGTIQNVSGSGSSYIVTVGGLTQPGNVTVNVNAGVGTDAAGNAGLASLPGEQVAVNFTTTTGVQVTPTPLLDGDSATVTATVAAPAGTTLGGSVLFTLTGPGGPINRTISLSSGSAATTFTGLAAGDYAVSATYQPATGYVTSNGSQNFTVDTPVVPVDQNAIGVSAAAAGSTIRVFGPTGSLLRTFNPFSAADSVGGVRAAVADVNGDGTPDVIAVNGPGAPALLRVFDGATSLQLYSISLFEGFKGGAFVAAGDLNGDGKADIVATPDQGGGPRVTVFNGPDGKVLTNFFGIEDSAFRGGARATLGDVNGDGRVDIVVSAGFGGGPRIAGYDGARLLTDGPIHLFNDFFLFEQQLRNGAYVTVGDLNNDGFGDIIGGGGPGGGPRVLAFSGKQLIETGAQVPLVNFFAGDITLRGGVRVAAKDFDGDGIADLATGSGDTGDMFDFFGADLMAGNTTPSRSVVIPGVLDGVYVG